MTNITFYKYNAYATNDAGTKQYRAVAISGGWRLTKKAPPKSRYDWLFVNDTIYDSMYDALAAIDTL